MPSPDVSQRVRERSQQDTSRYPHVQRMSTPSEKASSQRMKEGCTYHAFVIVALLER